MLAESYAYYFSKNTPMKIKYFKAQIVFLLWAVFFKLVDTFLPFKRLVYLPA